ncbi:MAG: CotH kinase family protein [bacterium]|nr:CotH kinase family protein [bacterium]
MKLYVLIIGFGFLILGCTKFEVKEELPDIENITPASMHSNLDRIHISVAPNDWVSMYYHYTENIEIEGLVEYHDAAGNLLFSKDATIRIKGASSRHHSNRSLGIKFHEVLDNQHFQIIDPNIALNGHDLSTIASLRLRNSGNDNGVTHFKDLAYSRLAYENGIALETKYGKPVHVFVNGEYYSLLNMRTEDDRAGLAALLNVDAETITLLKMDWPNGDIDFREGDEVLGQQFIDAINNEDEHALEELIDIENFIDYILFQDFIGNMDWPHNNVKLYSVDGSKFRFLLYDLDYAADRNRTQRLPKLEYLEDDFSKIYQVLRRHDNGFIDLLEEKQNALYTNLSIEKFNSIVDNLAEELKPEIGYLIKKRGAPNSVFQWSLNVDQLKQDFQVNDFYNRKLYGQL